MVLVVRIAGIFNPQNLIYMTKGGLSKVINSERICSITDWLCVAKESEVFINIKFLYYYNQCIEYR